MILLFLACKGGPVDSAAPIVHPTLLARPEHKALALERVQREPYASMLAQIEERAARELREPDPEVWDHDAHGANGETAAANAFLAWLYEDPDYAARAMDAVALLRDDFETNETLDANIRMPASLIGYTNAWDLLVGAELISDGDAEALREKLLTINEQFYERYFEDDFYRHVALEVTQNNHPIRTASAIGYVALAFPDAPQSEEWLDYALSDLSYLYSEQGHYIQPEGGVSEGPFYFGFGNSAALAFFIAADNALPEGATFHSVCDTRQDIEPWSDNGCVDGALQTFTNPLHGELLHAAARWSMDIRLPSGYRPPKEDAYFYAFNGGGLIGAFAEDPNLSWDWSHGEEPYPMLHGQDLLAQHLLYWDDSLTPEEPSYNTRFMPQSGDAVFRSGWDEDARWLLLIAENGPVRMTLHDHVDGTSFSMAAYGEYLLVDPGYYKPNDLDNARTSGPEAHNLILIDGLGAPEKGLLTDFGDADAFLENTYDGAELDYAEAVQSYQDSTIRRSVVFVRDRYFIVADRLETGSSAPREHRWRLGGWAGLDVPGVFTLSDSGARWERTLAGVDLSLACTAPGLRVEVPPLVEGYAPQVHEFDRERSVGHHGVIDGVVTAEAPNFLAVLAPYRVGDTGADGPMQVQALALGEGIAAWQIGDAELVVLREPGAAERLTLPDGTVVQTDAELSLWSTDGSLALIAGGSSLSVDGVVRASGGGALTVVEP